MVWWASATVINDCLNVCIVKRLSKCEFFLNNYICFTPNASMQSMHGFFLDQKEVVVQHNSVLYYVKPKIIILEYFPRKYHYKRFLSAKKFCWDLSNQETIFSLEKWKNSNMPFTYQSTSYLFYGSVISLVLSLPKNLCMSSIYILICTATFLMNLMAYLCK